MFVPSLVTPPSTRILALADAKAFLWVDHDDDDTLIEAFAKAAEMQFDGYSGMLGRCLITQTWRYPAADWGEAVLCRTMPGLTSAVIRYTDLSGAEQTVPGSFVSTVETAAGGLVVLGDDFSFPALGRRLDAVRVDATMGYGPSPSAVPGPIVEAIKRLTKHFYDNRDAASSSMAEIPFGITAMVSPYRAEEV